MQHSGAKIQAGTTPLSVFTDFLPWFLKLLYSNDVGMVESMIVSHYCNSHIIISSVVLLWWGYKKWHAWKGRHVYIWNRPNFGDIREYDKVSKLRILKLTITKSTAQYLVVHFCIAKVSKPWHQKFHTWHHCMLLWHQLWSHSAKSTPLTGVMYSS